MANLFYKISFYKFVRVLILDWLIIFSSIYLAEKYNHILLTLFIIFIIAIKQNALGVLFHDGIHNLIHPNRKINDTICDLTLGLPLFLSTFYHRSYHQQHHDHLMTDLDPDWHYKKDNSFWVFPQTRLKIMWSLLNSVYLNLTFIFTNRVRFTWKKISTLQKAKIILCYFCLFIFLHHNSLIHLFLLYWMCPLFLLWPMLNRYRGWSEHFGINTNLNTRDVIPIWWERLIIAPHNVGYHFTHHTYPNIPFYNLNKAYEAMGTESIYTSYFGFKKNSVLSNLLGR